MNRGLIVVFALCSTALSGYAEESFVSAADAANKIGETVVFQDTVKAVAYSRSTDGFYINFGAAYPKQVLSVWVPTAIYDTLPGNRALVERVVRINGQLEKGPDGPLLKMASRDQFELLNLDETVLGTAQLDGKRNRDHFMAAVGQTFRSGDFDKLEVLADELRQSRERFTDGTWISDAFFSAFGIRGRMPAAEIDLFARTMEEWEAKLPASLITPIIKADFHCDLGWQARGTRVASEVEPKGRRDFKSEMEIARAILDAHPPSKIYPAYFVVMQRVALGQGWPKEKFMRLFDEATHLEPDYYAFYFNTANFLLPRWYGEKGEWEAFAEHHRQVRGVGGAGDELYARIAWSMDQTVNNVFSDSAISWETMAAGMEFMIREHPDSRYLKNAYANFAWKARDRDRLRKLLPEIRPDPDMTVWVSLENVRLAEKVAASEPSP